MLKLECNISSDNMEIMTKNRNETGIEEGLQDIKEGRTSTFDEFLSKHGYDAAILELRSNGSSIPLTEYLAKKDM